MFRIAHPISATVSAYVKPIMTSLVTDTLLIAIMAGLWLAIGALFFRASARARWRAVKLGGDQWATGHNLAFFAALAASWPLLIIAIYGLLQGNLVALALLAGIAILYWDTWRLRDEAFRLIWDSEKLDGPTTITLVGQKTRVTIPWSDLVGLGREPASNVFYAEATDGTRIHWSPQWQGHRALMHHVLTMRPDFFENGNWPGGWPRDIKNNPAALRPTD